MAKSPKMQNVNRNQKSRLVGAHANEKTVPLMLEQCISNMNLTHEFSVFSEKDYPVVGTRLSMFHLEWNIEMAGFVVHDEETIKQVHPVVLCIDDVQPNSVYRDSTDGQLYFWNGTCWSNNKRKSGVKFERVGFSPDTIVVHKETGRFFIIESKNQEAAGNAHERADKYFACLPHLKNTTGVKTGHLPFAFVFSGGQTQHGGYRMEVKNKMRAHGAPNNIVFMSGDDTTDAGLISVLFANIILPAISY